MRDAFAVLFFVAVGMLLNPSRILENLMLVLGTLAIVMFGKALAAFLVVRLLRYPAATAVLVAVALAQIGEFSFILANLGRQLGVLPERATDVLVVTAVVSITLNPFLFRVVGPLSRRLTGAAIPPESERAAPRDLEGQAIVVGYGHVGRTITRLLSEHDLRFTVVELNLDTVTALREQGVRAVYGDATQAGVLEAAGVAKAGSLIFAASGTPPQGVVQVAKALNANIKILARSAYLSEVAASRRAGADLVVSAEAEVAFAMAEHLLRELGATPEQIDRARDRLREELDPRRQST